MKGLDYVEIDASRFLRHEFEWGTEVIAMDLDNGKWQKEWSWASAAQHEVLSTM